MLLCICIHTSIVSKIQELLVSYFIPRLLSEMLPVLLLPVSDVAVAAAVGFRNCMHRDLVSEIRMVQQS